MGTRLIKIYKDSTRFLDQDGKSARLNSSRLATARRNYIGTPTDRTYYASCGDVIWVVYIAETIEKERFEAGFEGRYTSRDANCKRKRVP